MLASTVNNIGQLPCASASVLRYTASVLASVSASTALVTTLENSERTSGYQSSSERSERSVRFEPNLRSERVRYFVERETNVQANYYLPILPPQQ